MSSPARPPGDDDDPVIAAIENAPLDPNVLSAEELEEFERLVAAGPGETKTTSEVLAEIAERAKAG